jgi:Rrf2 family transcriptional regulator, iron-sulfur cluster assembly transcription factor
MEQKHDVGSRTTGIRDVIITRSNESQMKISAQEEYGLRLLIRIAGCREREGLSISQLSEKEGLSSHYVAKLARALRMAGFIHSTPGNKGGYMLAKPAGEIMINDVLKSLGGTLFDKEFCGVHTGTLELCTRSLDCSLRSLWQMIQWNIDQLLEKVTLKDLMSPEKESPRALEPLVGG